MSDMAPVFPPDTDDYADAGAAQAQAADPNYSAWVAANAGSGKTKVLIDRVARLLLRRARPESILCITYTRAAANEMISRLYRQLGAWSVMQASELREKLGKLENRNAASYSEDELKAARALFAQALETPGGLRIETIHAFCARLLRRFPLEARIPPGFVEIEEADADRLLEAAAREAVLSLEREAPDVLDQLVLAGGGNGASTAIGLAHRLDAGDIEDPAAYKARLYAALGATGRSARDIIQQAAVTDLPVSQYRRAAEGLQGLNTTDITLAGRLTDVLNTDDAETRWQLLRPIWRTATNAMRASNPYTKKAPPDVADMFQLKEGEGTEITRLMTAEREWLAAMMAERTLALIALAKPLLHAFDHGKRLRGALDFDDLIMAARDLLTRPGLASWVLYKLDGNLTHVLLDEAQDTSPDQWTLVHSLTEEFFAGMGAERPQDPRTLFVVGDEKQSIYSFQGADPDAFLDGKRDFIARLGTGGVTPEMNMSFRSSPEILTFVDEVFNTDAFDGPPFSSAAPAAADMLRHTARRGNQPGRVELHPLRAPEPALEEDPWDAPLDVQQESSPKARLAEQVANDIAGMIARGETVWREAANGSWHRCAMNAGDVLILVRSRTGGLFDGLIRALKTKNLPVAGADRLRLTDHIGVQDCLNLMRFALMPGDDLTLAEILRGPFCDLVDDDNHLFKLAYGRRKGETLWSRLQANQSAEFAPARDLLTNLSERAHWPAFEFLSAVLDQAVLNSETGWDRIGARLGTPARDPVEALLARALSHDNAAGASLQSFIAAMDGDTTQIKRDLAEANGAIRIMTVHGAKGLQAPIVILPDTTSASQRGVSGLLNLGDGIAVWAGKADEDTDSVARARALAVDKDLQEHRRLLYVALTRAQDRLIIHGAWKGGERSKTGHDSASWYGLASAAMDRLGVSEAEDDAPRTFGDAPPSADAGQNAGAEQARGPAWLRAPAPPAEQAVRAISPSHLVADMAPVIDPLAPRTPDRRLRGRLIHALLERLPHLPAGERKPAAMAYLAREPELDDMQRAEIVATSLTTLDAPDMAHVFAAHGRAEVAIVGKGTGWPESTLINGRVDRLVRDGDDLLIVDIKTDRPPPAKEDGVGEAYLAQMATYANVLEAGADGLRVSCAIVWTDGPRLMTLSRERLLAALKRAQSRV